MEDSKNQGPSSRSPQQGSFHEGTNEHDPQWIESQMDAQADGALNLEDDCGVSMCFLFS